MRHGKFLPRISSEASLGEALEEMTNRDNLGVTLVIDSGGSLDGIITDGDIRRIFLAPRDSGDRDILARPVKQFMTRNPKVVESDVSAAEALRIMEVHAITSLAVVDSLGRPQGILHLHDILGRGKFLI